MTAPLHQWGEGDDTDALQHLVDHAETKHIVLPPKRMLVKKMVTILIQEGGSLDGNGSTIVTGAPMYAALRISAPEGCPVRNIKVDDSEYPTELRGGVAIFNPTLG